MQNIPLIFKSTFVTAAHVPFFLELMYQCPYPYSYAYTCFIAVPQLKAT